MLDGQRPPTERVDGCDGLIREQSPQDSRPTRPVAPATTTVRPPDGAASRGRPADAAPERLMPSFGSTVRIAWILSQGRQLSTIPAPRAPRPPAEMSASPLAPDVARAYYLRRGTSPLMTGRAIAQYTILGKIGQGGMGMVYRARDLRLDRLVAIKVLPSDKIQTGAPADSSRKPRRHPPSTTPTS